MLVLLCITTVLNETVYHRAPVKPIFGQQIYLSRKIDILRYHSSRFLGQFLSIALTQDSDEIVETCFVGKPGNRILVFIHRSLAI